MDFVIGFLFLLVVGWWDNRNRNAWRRRGEERGENN